MFNTGSVQFGSPVGQISHRILGMNRTRFDLVACSAAVSLALTACLFTRADTALAEAAPAPVAKDQRFDGQRSYEYLKQICKFGSRMSGSEGMEKQQALLLKHFQALGAKAELQKVPPFRHPLNGSLVPAANIVVQWHPEARERILLCAHYDTRPFPDQEPNPRLRQKPFIGANDGASGVALLMELGHHVRDLPERYGLDVVFFDAEEFVFSERGQYFIGSEHFAREYVRNPPEHRYVAGVLLDMVGDRKLSVFQETYSRMWPDTRPIVKEIWATADRLGVEEFHPREGYRVKDDHLAIRNIAGIPTCNIIDFHYPNKQNSFWHTTRDVPENCSAESLGKVGWVVQEWLKSKK